MCVCVCVWSGFYQEVSNCQVYFLSSLDVDPKLQSTVNIKSKIPGGCLVTNAMYHLRAANQPWISPTENDELALLCEASI